VDDDEAVVDGLGRIIGTGKLKLAVVCLVGAVYWINAVEGRTD